MRLIIAEKPSLARAIAAAIPGQHRPFRHHIECATGDVIAWCAGHILEMVPPEDYSPELKTWSLETLPIVPKQWQLRASTPELVRSIEGLLTRASRVVHAGDPDREGQLLVDEVLQHLGWHGPTDRLLITDLSPTAVQRSLDSLEPNERFAPLYAAALGRQRADWLYGINLTRLYTLRARLAGYAGVLSVGRVQTPLLGMIVRRDRDIEGFVAKPFYAVEGAFRTAKGEDFPAKWVVGKEHESQCDAEGRLLSRTIAEALCRKVAGQVASVATQEQSREAESAPLPYSLSDLQIAAGGKLGWSAAQVLEVAQRLYERQLITYPRSDCSYLPEEHWGQARGVLETILQRSAGLAAACAAADLNRRSKAWNDAKITAHHAIIPTDHRQPAPLDATEAALYELVARRYVQQFLPSFEYLQTSATLLVRGETFQARGRQVLALGWKAFDEPAQEVTDDDPQEEAPPSTALPALRVGDSVACRSARVLEKSTQPPKAFTDATLIRAMCNVAKFVADPKARQILRDTDGIGTPATRAAILETLFARGYVLRQKKQIRSTAVGRALIDALPVVATTPDQTAVWEAALRRVHDQQLELERFLGAVSGQLGELVARGQAAGPLTVPVEASRAPSRARPRASAQEGTRKRARRPRSAAGRASP